MENRIGEARKRYQKTHGKFTQKDAASYFMVSESTYKKWEQGRGLLNGSQLREIAYKYGVSVDYLLKIDKPQSESDPYLDELQRIANSITTEGKRQLMIYARGIASSYPKSDTVQSKTA